MAPTWQKGSAGSGFFIIQFFQLLAGVTMSRGDCANQINVTDVTCPGNLLHMLLAMAMKSQARFQHGGMECWNVSEP
jgi:hypothetical protein